MGVSNEDVRIQLENELELRPGAQELILRNENFLPCLAYPLLPEFFIAAIFHLGQSQLP